MEMNISKYFAFIKTVEHGSFTKAAEILNYSQSGISRMINDLENEWGIALLERSKGGVKLTSDGMKLLPYAQSLCAEYDRFQRQVDNIKGIDSGIIRIGAFSSVATHWLPNMIKKFREDHPNIEYEILLGDYAETEKNIQTGRVDMGFLSLPTKEPLETEFIENDELAAVIPNEHPLASLDKFPMDALCHEPFMLLEKGEKTEISKIFETNGLKPNICFTTWDDYAIMSMVEKGLGISILPRLILKRIPYKIMAKSLENPAYRKIGIAFQNRSELSIAAKKFIEYLAYRN